MLSPQLLSSVRSVNSGVRCSLLSRKGCIVIKQYCSVFCVYFLRILVFLLYYNVLRQAAADLGGLCMNFRIIVYCSSIRVYFCGPCIV